MQEFISIEYFISELELYIELYNENKQANAAEICKLFCMPIDVLNGKATQETLSQFVQNCLMPPINTIESALDHDLLTEAEKAAHYYFAFDTSELTRGDFASRINAYAVALQNNIYQLDEIREMEDKPPLGFNYIRLSLADVLLDPKTGKIYTPNTDKMSLMGSNSELTNDDKGDTIESRGNPYHDPTNGRFTSGSGGAGKKMSNSSASLSLKPPRIGIKERRRLSSQILSDFPNLPPSDRKYAYENRNHFYLFSVNDYGGNYTFWMKKKLTPENQAKFDAYRRMAENGEI